MGHKSKGESPKYLSPADAWSLVEAQTHLDRGLVMLCAAIFDRRLEILLRIKFQLLAPDATKGEVEFFLTKRPIPPLGSSGLRAKMLRLLGVIDKQTANLLDDFFSLRNAFAHKETPPALDECHIAEMCERLPASPKTRFASYRDDIREQGDSPIELLKLFTVCLVYALAEAEDRLDAEMVKSGVKYPCS